MLRVRKDLEKVHPIGFEPTTFGSVDRCSIQLSYGCLLIQGLKCIPIRLFVQGGFGANILAKTE